MPGRPRHWLILVALAAVAGLVFTGTSTFDFALYLDRQVHGLHCSFLPGLGSVDITGASGCHVTLMSPYSSVFRKALWGGIPISLAGMATFALVLYRTLDLLLRHGNRSRGDADATGLKTLVALTLVPTLTSVVMGTIALQVLDAVCKLCIGTYIASGLTLVGALGALLSAGRRDPYADLDEEGDPDNDPQASSPTRPLAPALGLLGIQLALFTLLPTVVWAAMVPDFSQRLASCGELADASDTHGVLLSLSKGDVPAIEILDPLCPSCKAFEERLATSGQGALLSRQVLLFPLDSSCNWMVDTTLHPGACTVSEAMICAADDAPQVLAWAFAHQEQIRTETAADPEAAARLVSAAFPQVKGCIGRPAVRTKLNHALRWGVKNQLSVLTPQLYVDGRRVCDADTDLGLDYTLAQILAARDAPSTATAGER